MNLTELTPGKLRRLQQLFEEALELPEAERGAFLRDRSGFDRWLCDEVSALLRAHARADVEFGSPVSVIAPAIPDADEDRWKGMRIGPWEVVRRIGIGGMGTVWQAVRADEQYRQQVAVKFLHRHAGGAAAIRRFKAERQILANLSHPNIATLIDGGVTDDGQPYLAMEYVDGQPITQWCDDHRLGTRDRVKLFLQVCAAVETAHRNLVIHRDLKPGNILVTVDGHVKLLDFGIARLLKTVGDEPVGALPATVAAYHSFTPDYAAPEQVVGGMVGTTTDVYSLGVILFELLSGRRPFNLRTCSILEIGRKICDTAPPRPGVNDDVDAIILTALRKESERRYGSVSLLAADLRNYLDGKPVTARPDVLGYRLRKLVARHRAGTVVAVLAVAAVLTATGVAFWQADAARRAAGDTALINAFLLDVLQMSDPFEAGSELTLSEALDEAAERIDERFAGRPDLTAEIRFGLGYSMLSRYRLDNAERQLLLALQESRVEFGEDDIRTLRVLEGVAGLRHEQGRIDEAQALFEQALTRAEAAGLEADPLYMQLLGNLGNLHLTQERYPEAERFLQRARVAAEMQGEELTLDRANLVSNLAHAAHGHADLDRADALYREAQTAYASLFPDGSPDLAILLNNRALLAEERGRNESALALHRESLAVRRRVFGSEHPMLVVALTNVARMSLATGDRTLARSTAQDAAALADRVYSTPHIRHAGAYAVLAEARLADDDLPGATTAWQRAETLLSGVGDAPPRTVRNLERVGSAICQRAGVPGLCSRAPGEPY